MEQNQEDSLFGFGIDQASRAHLSEAAKWGRFLAIIGFIVCGFLVIVGLFAGTFFSTQSYDSPYERSSFLGSNLGLVMIIVYLGVAILNFFPCLFLLKFANRMRNALNTNDQMTLNSSFQNLKIMFRFVGIVTIVVISMYVILFFVGILTAASSAF